MKEYKKKKIKEIEEKKLELEEGNYFSKIIKHIDGELTFDRAIKRIYLNKNNSTKDNFLNDKYHKILSKKCNTKKQENNKIYTNKLNNNINDDKKKYVDGIFRLNKISRIKRLSYLPQISPYIYSNNTAISIDYNKANEMGARGFRSLCNNESDSIKEILLAYNDDNYKNIYDYNTCLYFNNINDKLKEINNKNENIADNGEEKKFYSDTTRYDNEIKNIFDKNYIEKKKITKTDILLKNKLERIKIRNKKVNKILFQYKNKYYNKNVDNRIYKINYKAIEKHVPYTKLNTKSKRIFPESFIKKYNNFTSYDYINEKNKIKNKMLKKNISNKMLCSSFSLNSPEKNYKKNKISNVIYNMKNIYITKENSNLSNDDNISFIHNKTDINNVINYIDNN